MQKNVFEVFKYMSNATYFPISKSKNLIYCKRSRVNFYFCPELILTGDHKVHNRPVGTTFLQCPFPCLRSPLPPLFVPFILYVGSFFLPLPLCLPSFLNVQTKPALSAEMLCCEDRLWVSVSWNALKTI